MGFFSKINGEYHIFDTIIFFVIKCNKLTFFVFKLYRPGNQQVKHHGKGKSKKGRKEQKFISGVSMIRPSLLTTGLVNQYHQVRKKLFSNNLMCHARMVITVILTLLWEGLQSRMIGAVWASHLIGDHKAVPQPVVTTSLAAKRYCSTHSHSSQLNVTFMLSSTSSDKDLQAITMAFNNVVGEIDEVVLPTSAPKTKEARNSGIGMTGQNTRCTTVSVGSFVA